jgi:5'-3' exonuclease
MGIKKIKKFLDTYAPDAIQVKQIDDYKNKTVAIDILNMLYRSVIAIRKQGYDIYNDNCQVSVTHIHALLNKIIGLHKYNIKGVCVFDGIPPDIKLDALDKRRLRKKKILNIYDTLSEEEKKKYYYIQHAVTSYEIFECKLLLRICGFPIIDAPQESDSQCAYLSKKGIVQYIISDDSDILLFGGKNIIKNFSVDKRK